MKIKVGEKIPAIYFFHIDFDLSQFDYIKTIDVNHL